MRTANAPPLPERLCRWTTADGEFVPAWLSDRDRPWLRDLVEHARGAVGGTVAAMRQRLRGSEPDPRAGQRQRAAAFVLEAWLAAAASGPARVDARRALFELRARGAPVEVAYREVAATFRASSAELEATLFADLPDQRRVRWPEPAPEPGRLLLAANTAMVRGLLRHAEAAELRLWGGARTVMRTAWLLGAHAEFAAGADQATTLRFLEAATGGRPHVTAALVQLLPWTQRFRLVARCRIAGQQGRLVLATGDPLLPAPEPRRFDSRLERAFAADFAEIRPGWRLVREPAPLQLAGGLAFPDFGIVPDLGACAPWWCEIAGLRDERALPQKLALLAHPRAVLCLPRRAVPPELQMHPRLVAFGARVPVAAVAAVIERMPS
ncbi:MAG: DUF790 family protein [Planctomycetota bacterium]